MEQPEFDALCLRASFGGGRSHLKLSVEANQAKGSLGTDAMQ